MSKKKEKQKAKRIKRKERMSKILLTISHALKDYATPASERKLARKIKKANKNTSTIAITKKSGTDK